MKERKTSGMTSQKQIIIAGCLMLIFVTCLTGLYIARRMQQPNRETQIAENNDKISEDADIEPIESVDSVILPEVWDENEVEEAPQVEPKQDVIENNDMDVDVAAEEPAESQPVTPVGGSAVKVEPAAPTLQFSGELQWPVEGSVLMNYSMDQSIYFATLDQYKYNPAMIIDAQSGDAVMAAAAGTITQIKEDAQTGLTVTMDIGDGYEVSYGQMQDLNFKEGVHLDAGDVIGTIAPATKYYSVEGDNLYFALTKDGAPADPTEYLPQ